MSFHLKNTTKFKIPEFPYEAMKNMALGENYDLSFVIVDETEIHNLNKTYRQKDQPTDILSFPVSDTMGEIFICPPQAELEAPKFDRSYENFIGFLFIHGLVHLKGFDHGSTMETNERKIRDTFGI